MPQELGCFKPTHLTHCCSGRGRWTYALSEVGTNLHKCIHSLIPAPRAAKSPDLHPQNKAGPCWSRPFIRVRSCGQRSKTRLGDGKAVTQIHDRPPRRAPRGSTRGFGPTRSELEGQALSLPRRCRGGFRSPLPEPGEGAFPPLPPWSPVRGETAGVCGAFG